MSDDTTPPRNRHASGEWHDLTSWMRRLEGKLDTVITAQGNIATANALLDQRLKAVETWQSERRQFGLGVWLSIISAVASPIATLVIVNVHH